MNKRGEIFEKIAKEYLLSKGYKIISTNYFTKYGEIDIIAKKGKQIVAVEVKGNNYKGEFLFNRVNKAKLKKISKALQLFLINENSNYDSFRIDVVFVQRDGDNYCIHHIENVTI